VWNYLKCVFRIKFRLSWNRPTGGAGGSYRCAGLWDRNSPVAMGGGFGGLSPETKLQDTPNWNAKHYKFVEFCQIWLSSPPPCTNIKLPRTNVKPPYWRLSGDGSGLEPFKRRTFTGVGRELSHLSQRYTSLRCCRSTRHQQRSPGARCQSQQLRKVRLFEAESPVRRPWRSNLYKINAAVVVHFKCTNRTAKKLGLSLKNNWC